MKAPYHKAAIAQDSEFLGFHSFKAALRLPHILRSTPGSVSHLTATEFRTEGLCVAVSENEAAVTLGKREPCSVGR